MAKSDPYGLYNSHMDDDFRGCQITRYDFSGGTVEAPGSTASDWENRPVNYVSWGDAARFANWLHNSQPVGPQDLTTTEDGAYFLNGATTDLELMAVTRESDATWFLSTENQWYKAAFYDGAHSVYHDYPTGTNAVPDNGNPGGDTGNTANFYDGDRFFSNGDFTVGSPYWTTPVGQFSLSESPYGTFDQCSNVWEWNETAVNSLVRGLRGGAWCYEFRQLHASFRDIYLTPTFEFYGVGFRVARVPEPGGITLLVYGLVAGLMWWRRRAG